METTFIYALCEPDSPTRTVRYIGKSDNPEKRLQAHVKRAKINERQAPRDAWIRALLVVGKLPKLVVLREVPQIGWQEWEQRYIRAARCLDMRLTNETDGGEGVSLPGKLNPFFGKTHTADAILKNRNAHIGKKHTPEACAKISAGNTGKKLSPEACAKIGKSHLGTTHTPEAKEKIRIAKTGPNNVGFGKKHPNGSSQFFGVSWHKATKKWRTRVGNFYLGVFNSEDMAARAYDEFVIEYWGAVTELNFPN